VLTDDAVGQGIGVLSGGERRGTRTYTADRSRSLAFGSTTILFGEAVTWDTLVRQSTERTEPLMLELGPTTGG
jgi:hypothetical protein